MAEQTRTTLKTYFETGDTPTESQFADLIDSVSNITDDGILTSEKWYITTDIAIDVTGDYTILAADAGSYFAITKLICIRTATGSGEARLSLQHNSTDIGSITTYMPNGIGGYQDLPLYTQYGFTLDLTYPLVIVGAGSNSGVIDAYLKGVKYS